MSAAPLASAAPSSSITRARARARRAWRALARSRAADARRTHPFTTPDLLCFTCIVDDLVSHDGSTAMAQMGGGGPQSLWGAQHYAWLAAQRGSGGSSSGSGGSSALSVALSAGVGADFPSPCQGWLEALGVETCGVVEVGGAETPRAWQLTEADGRRTQVWRVRADEQLYALLRPKRVEDLPPQLRAPRAAHVGVPAEGAPLDLLRGLRTSGAFVSAETFKPAEAPLAYAELVALCSTVDLFSPNALEAASILGVPAADAAEDPEALAAALMDAGAPRALVRCGEAGAVFASRGCKVRAPAVRGVDVLDPTGCGNAMLGAFVAALAVGGETPEAALAHGTAAAAAMAEVVGVPPLPPWAMGAQYAELARARYEDVLQNVVLQ